MKTSLDFLNPYNEKYDNTEELRGYYKDILFPKILKQFEKGDSADLLRVRIALKDALMNLQKEAAENYAFKAAYSLRFMISAIHSDYILKDGINPLEIPCRLLKLYRFSRAADSEIEKIFDMNPARGYSQISSAFESFIQEKQEDALGIFFMIQAIKSNIPKQYKKQDIKLVGQEMLNLSIEDLQTIWDYYKEANPDYQKEPFDKSISKNLPLHVMIRWALDKGDSKYIDIVRKMLGIEFGQLPFFAEGMGFNVENAIFYVLNEDIPSCASSDMKSSCLLRWALKNSETHYVKKFSKDLGISAELAESLIEFYKEEYAKSDIKSPTRDKSIMLKWSLKNSLINQIDIFKDSMDLESADVIDYAIAMNYDIYGALIYSIEEELYDSIERLVSKYGWNEGRNLSKIFEFLKRAMDHEDISEFESLVKVPEIWHFISNNWEDITDYAKLIEADDIILFLEDFDILNERGNNSKKSHINDVFCGEGIRPLTDTMGVKAEKLFVSLQEIISKRSKSAEDSGIDMNSSASSLEDVIWVADDAQHRLDVTFIVNPSSKVCSLGEIGDTFC